VTSTRSNLAIRRRKNKKEKSPPSYLGGLFWIRTTPYGEILIAATALTPDSNNVKKYNLIKEGQYERK
jgi:hypothetical protein